MARPKKTIKITILGSKWKVRFWSGTQYDRHVDDSSLAICHVTDKIVDFDIDEITHNTIAHELTHCYISQMSFVELQLTEMQIEEAFCELMGNHGRAIIALSDAILDEALAL